MSHIVLTQTKIDKSTSEDILTSVLIKCEDIAYSNPADDDTGHTYVNLNLSVDVVSIRVTETATEIADLIAAALDFED